MYFQIKIIIKQPFDKHLSVHLQVLIHFNCKRETCIFHSKSSRTNWNKTWKSIDGMQHYTQISSRWKVFAFSRERETRCSEKPCLFKTPGYETNPSKCTFQIALLSLQEREGNPHVLDKWVKQKPVWKANEEIRADLGANVDTRDLKLWDKWPGKDWRSK